LKPFFLRVIFEYAMAAAADRTGMALADALHALKIPPPPPPPTLKAGGLHADTEESQMRNGSCRSFLAVCLASSARLFCASIRRVIRYREIPILAPPTMVLFLLKRIGGR
jgi:hypothetical protein